jgi:hypothetical protein
MKQIKILCDPEFWRWQQPEVMTPKRQSTQPPPPKVKEFWNRPGQIISVIRNPPQYDIYLSLSCPDLRETRLVTVWSGLEVVWRVLISYTQVPHGVSGSPSLNRFESLYGFSHIPIVSLFRGEKRPADQRIYPNCKPCTQTNEFVTRFRLTEDAARRTHRRGGRTVSSLYLYLYL